MKLIRFKLILIHTDSLWFYPIRCRTHDLNSPREWKLHASNNNNDDDDNNNNNNNNKNNNNNNNNNNNKNNNNNNYNNNNNNNKLKKNIQSKCYLYLIY